MTGSAQNADFRRKPLIFADAPLHLEIQAFRGRRKPQICADSRRKPQEAEDFRRLGSVALVPSPLASSFQNQRQRDDKNKIFAFEGGGALGAERRIVRNAVFVGNATTIKF